MKYYLELRIDEYIKPNDLDILIRNPLADRLVEVGNVCGVIPEYQSHQSWDNGLLELNFNGKILYFKYIKISISLSKLSDGVTMIKNFLKANDFDKSSKLLFSDERYNLLDMDFRSASILPK